MTLVKSISLEATVFIASYATNNTTLEKMSRQILKTTNERTFLFFPDICDIRFFFNLFQESVYISSMLEKEGVTSRLG